MWVFDDGCANCEEYTKYKSADSETSQLVDDKFAIKYGKGSVEGNSIKDTVYLTADMEVKKQIFGAVDKIVDVKMPCDGLLGKFLFINSSVITYKRDGMLRTPCKIRTQCS